MFLLYVCHRLYGLPVAISGRHDVALCMPWTALVVFLAFLCRSYSSMSVLLLYVCHRLYLLLSTSVPCYMSPCGCLGPPS
jgi:hypothetical protein